MIALVGSLLTTISGIASIAKFLDDFAAAVTAWYIAKQGADTLSSITDSIALLGKAKTDEDRYAAMQSLQKSLSRTRIIS